MSVPVNYRRRRRSGMAANPGYIDCGGGLQVQQGSTCPVITQIDPNDPNVIKAQADYNARAARCTAFTKKQQIVFAGAGVAALAFLPGWWKAAGLAAVGFGFLQAAFGGAWRSPDCDYGF